MTETNYESVATDLVGRIDKLHKKIARVDERRAVLALDAHIGDSTAIKERDKLGEERNRLAGEVDDLNAALNEARRRANDATNAVAAEAVRKRAEQAAIVVQRLLARGPEMDHAIALYTEHFRGIQNDLTELARLGAPTPSRPLVDVNINVAHDSALTPLGDKFVRPVPPTRRRTFDFLLRGWCTPAKTWIESKITNTAADAA